MFSVTIKRNKTRIGHGSIFLVGAKVDGIHEGIRSIKVFPLKEDAITYMTEKLIALQREEGKTC